MSTFTHDAVVVRGADAETYSNETTSLRLLVDASGTGGALGAHRVQLTGGALGAPPHYHSGSSELFLVIDGSLQMLNGDRMVEAGAGDLVVVPPGMHHAFGAAAGAGLDVLIVITPGVERFEYFRLLERLSRGAATYQELLAVQEQYDSWSVDSPVWTAARPRT